MDDSARGQRIARARRRRGLSQSALAGLVGRSESWLSQVERGMRQVDSHTVLTSLAEILRVNVADLTGSEPDDPQASRYSAAQEIERAMMAYDALESAIGPDSPTLMETGGVGSEIYACAFQKVTGHALKQMADVSGRTEPVIFRETLALPGLDDPGNLFSQFASEQGSRLRRSCRQCWRTE